ncbi:3-isopropylmalate dehydratase small subunit [Oceanicoccus sagamiensis]|uniref:3-isopropylmalate dehydratase small subunit n=1 Tax=Oceanicoccus sagamiensis TaxID=716816 RepID=A0A1X9NBR7_9GAMM|nr:3-isopropylmalate dehydratase small subunit [Oceanicoccus sagamiensis]ARN73345.1 3-isopropylmalate dehydratase small subunit [Oceanicoccus sagamiensis]
MEKFTEHTGVAAPILRINVDTDAIIPSREMKLVSKQGLGEGLFAGWRYSKPGSRDINPDFILNKDEYANTSIILSGSNFGCGSSREHAVWALKEYGIRAIIAPSFGAIFHQNCIRNGILPITLSEEAINTLAQQIEQAPQQQPLTINLPAQQIISTDSKQRYIFDIEDSHKDMLVNGLDAIALTLSMEDQIAEFENNDRSQRSWAYLD